MDPRAAAHQGGSAIASPDLLNPRGEFTTKLAEVVERMVREKMRKGGP